MPEIVVYRWEAPLFFANAGMFRQQVRRLVVRGRPRWIVLQCEAITDIDVTAADMLKRLDLELNARGVHLAFVELRSRLQELVVRYGLSRPSIVSTSIRQWPSLSKAFTTKAWRRRRRNRTDRCQRGPCARMRRSWALEAIQIDGGLRETPDRRWWWGRLASKCP